MQIIVNILLHTSLLLLICISFYLLYSVVKYFNISQAVIISFGAYFTFLFQSILNFHFILSVLLAIILSVLVNLISDIIIFKPMRSRNLPSFAFLVASIGLYTVLQNCISLYFGDDTKTINTGAISVGHNIFGAYITTVQIVTIFVSIALFIAMYILYNKTILGKQIRAVSESQDLANIFGISSNKIILICVALSSALGAIAGILSALDTNLTPTMGFNLLLYGVVAMIIGGVGSFRGLLLGSLLVATSQNLVAYYLDTKWMDAVAYIILIAFLLWKPLGFSGKRLKKIEI
jgi:branched-chain amino acid transport system permease protein